MGSARVPEYSENIRKVEEHCPRNKEQKQSGKFENLISFKGKEAKKFNDPLWQRTLKKEIHNLIVFFQSTLNLTPFEFFSKSVICVLQHFDVDFKRI